MINPSTPLIGDRLRRVLPKYEAVSSRYPRARLCELVGGNSHWDAEQTMLDTYPATLSDGNSGLTKRNLEAIVRWKSPRVWGYVKQEDAQEIQTVSARAIAESDPAKQLEILTELYGVGTSTASAILLYVDPERYTPMDTIATTALARLGRWDGPTDADIETYPAYLEACQDLAAETGLTLREVDRALFVLDRTPN